MKSRCHVDLQVFLPHTLTDLGVGYIGTHQWLVVQSLLTHNPKTACTSLNGPVSSAFTYLSIHPFTPFIHSSYLASRIILHGAMRTRPLKINSGSQSERGGGWGPRAIKISVMVTSEGNLYNGRLLASVSVAASNTS